MDLHRFLHWDNSIGVFTLGAVGFCFLTVFVIGFFKTKSQTNKLNKFLESND